MDHSLELEKQLHICNIEAQTPETTPIMIWEMK